MKEKGYSCEINKTLSLFVVVCWIVTAIDSRRRESRPCPSPVAIAKDLLQVQPHPLMFCVVSKRVVRCCER